MDCPPEQNRSGRCGEVAVSGGFDCIIFSFRRFDDSLTAALSTLLDWRFKNENDLKGIIIRVSGNFELLRVK